MLGYFFGKFSDRDHRIQVIKMAEQMFSRSLQSGPSTNDNQRLEQHCKQLFKRNSWLEKVCQVVENYREVLFARNRCHIIFRELHGFWVFDLSTHKLLFHFTWLFVMSGQVKVMAVMTRETHTYKKIYRFSPKNLCIFSDFTREKNTHRSLCSLQVLMHCCLSEQTEGK